MVPWYFYDITDYHELLSISYCLKDRRPQSVKTREILEIV